MKLQDNLFKILDKTCHNDATIYKVLLLPNAEIYKAHFPNKPITPGVCIVQIIIELLSNYLQQEHRLCGAKNIKFLQVIDPLKTQTINVELKKIVNIDDSHITFQALVSNEEVVFTKVSLKCKK